MTSSTKGIGLALGSYVMWGLFPAYWKLLTEVPLAQLIGHRFVWSFLVAVLVVVITRQGRALGVALRNRKVLVMAAGAGIFLGINWMTFIWAVSTDRVVEGSLGYFINPLLSVVLGVVLLHERLRRLQWVAIGIAALGVLYLTFVYGQLPWISLALALSFGLYGLIKKTIPLRSLESVVFEMGIFFIPALIYVVWLQVSGRAVFFNLSRSTDLFIVGMGIVTIVPLLMFAAAAQRIPLSMVGMCQYLTPTMQFLLGVLAYNEPFTRTRAIGFSFVWVALILFAVEGIWARQRQQA